MLSNLRSLLILVAHRQQNCFDDILVTRTTTEIARESETDFLLSGARVFFQERQQRHEKTGRAKAALQGVGLLKGLLQRVQSARGSWLQALNGGDRCPVRLNRKKQARTNRLLIEKHGAGTANAVLATNVSAGQTQMLSKKIAQQEPRFNFTLVFPPVNGDRDLERLAQIFPQPFARSSGRESLQIQTVDSSRPIIQVLDHRSKCAKRKRLWEIAPVWLKTPEKWFLITLSLTLAGLCNMIKILGGFVRYLFGAK